MLNTTNLSVHVSLMESIATKVSWYYFCRWLSVEFKTEKSPVIQVNKVVEVAIPEFHAKRLSLTDS